MFMRPTEELKKPKGLERMKDLSINEQTDTFLRAFVRLEFQPSWEDGQGGGGFAGVLASAEQFRVGPRRPAVAVASTATRQTSSSLPRT